MAKKFNVKELREKVLASDDIQYDSVFVPEWDVELPIKTLSTAEMKKVSKYHEDPIRMAILAVLHGCKTEDGETVFLEADLAAFEANKAFAPIQRISEKILEMSGFDEDAVKEAKND